MSDNTLIIDRKRVDLLMERAQIKSYRKLAQAAGIHENTIFNVLRGAAFDSNTAKRLALVLHCNPIDLMTAEGFPDPNSVALAVP